jgi:hypothetical protein
MRGTRDALRSVGRYLDLALNDGPPLLGEVYWQPPGAPDPTWRWTHLGVAPGCLEVGEAQWMWLKRSQRGPDDAVVLDGRRWARSRLTWDPSIYLASVGLPQTGTPVAETSLAPTGEEWEVRFWAERGEFREPFCRVSLVTASGTSGPALYYEVSQPMAIECYPNRADDPEGAIDRATAVQDALLHAFRGRGTDEARPKRIPLYDYDGVPLDQGVAESRLDTDFMRVTDFSPRLLPDLQDPRRVGVVADVRLSWRKDVRLEELPQRPSPIGGAATGGSVVPVRGGRLVESVDVEITGS